MDEGIFNNGIQMPVQLQKVNEPVNWQQVHIQAAITAMQAELTNPNNVFSMCDDKLAIITKRAVRYADALIAELQKKGG